MVCSGLGWDITIFNSQWLEETVEINGVSQQSVSDIATVDESPEVATSSEEHVEVSAVNADVSEFENLFHRLGYANDDSM